MLKFYETFQRCNVPEVLKEDLFNSNNEKLNTIENFSKINIFIGANNSGKSKLIREIIKQKPINYYGNDNWKFITEIISKIFSIVNEKLSQICLSKNYFIISNSGNGQIFDTEELLKAKERLVQYLPDYNISDTINFLEHNFVILLTNLKRNSSYNIREKNSSARSLDDIHRQKVLIKCDEIKEEVEPLITKLKKFQFSSFAKPEMPRIYIPSVRTLRPFGMVANIKEQTINEYSFPEHNLIYNGQDFPNEVFRLTNSKYSEHQKLIQFEELLSKEFFDSKKVKLTFDNDQKVLLIKIGDEAEKYVYDLGDGLQMIIILTFPFFTHESGLIAIEEPELFIHPGLQKTLIKFLINHPRTENFQIFLATHSNHIIDSINQSDLVSLFSLKRREKERNNSLEVNPDFIIENLAFGNENFLNLLGITTTSVYLSNCTIWVEGITDKLYLQKYISEYLNSKRIDQKHESCKEYKEGIHYSFALTGGDSIIHWDFSDENEYYENTKDIIVRKFCSKALVVVDNDFGKNIERKKLLKNLLGDRLVELENPEIENLLPQMVINKTLLSYSSVKKAVGEGELPKVDKEEFKTKKIGYIIDKLILKDNPSAKKFSAKEGGESSLKSGDKFIFCKKAVEFINSDNLTEEAIDLTKRILDFVIARNQ